MLDLADVGFLRALRMLKLIVHRYFGGRKVGQRRSLRAGTSVDFKDHKPYTPGDDLRFVDWNVYGRLDRLMVKLFHDEQGLHVYVLVDASQSMLFGEPSKFDHARRIAAAIAWMASSAMDHVRVLTYADGVREESPDASRPGHAFNLFRFLEKARGGGRGGLAAAVRELVGRHRRRGAVFVVSDLMVDDAIDASLRLLRFHKHEVFLVHVLDDDEMMPRFAGHHEFVDSEDGSRREIHVDGLVLDAYAEVLDEFTSGVESLCRRLGITYVRAPTSIGVEATVLALVRSGAGSRSLPEGAEAPAAPPRGG
jgi:uncharacterized protein (DUF58 family)